MRKIKKEIAQRMTGLAESNGALTSSFIFPEEFIGFQGHFPGNKVLPGVCQIQCIASMLEAWKNKAIAIKEIVLAKFLAPVMPSEELTCVCKLAQETDLKSVSDKRNENFIVKAYVNKGSERVAEFKLKVCL